MRLSEPGRLLRPVQDLERTFELVTDYWIKSDGASRSFAYFRLSEVANFRRSPGLLKRIQHFRGMFVAREAKGTWVIQGAEARAADGTHNLKLSMGNSFGSLTFKYGRNATSCFARSTRLNHAGR